MLALAGHDVTVLEKGSSDEEWCGGYQVPPNVTKILFEWGLEDELNPSVAGRLETTVCADSEFPSSRLHPSSVQTIPQ